MREILEEMLNTLEENDESMENRGVPVSAIIYNPISKEILFSITNNKTKSKTVEPTTHAEHLCLEWLENNKNNLENLNIIISIPPCGPCLEEIANNEILTKVLFLSARFQKGKIKKLANSKIPFEQYIPNDENEIKSVKKIKKYIDGFNYSTKN